MKRSEVHLALIEILIEECPNIIEVGHITGRMLDKCEEMGMSPPSYAVLMRDGTKYVRGENEGDTMSAGGWEPEDE